MPTRTKLAAQWKSLSPCLFANKVISPFRITLVASSLLCKSGLFYQLPLTDLHTLERYRE